MLGFYCESYGTHPDQFPAARDSDANSMAIPLHNHMDGDYWYDVEAPHWIGR